MNNVLYLTFGPLGNQSSHLVRLYHALPILKNNFGITILNLTGEIDTKETQSKFKKINFDSFQLRMTGWNIDNITELKQHILDTVQTQSIDLVVLQMEVWDIMRELPPILPANVRMCTVVHAMPFLGSPITPSSSFSKDVQKRLKEITTQYRRNYTADHYHETKDVLRSHFIISSSESVNNFIHNYFPNLPTTLLRDHVKRVSIHNRTQENFDFDCIYMARIEEGKGLRYLPNVIEQLSLLLKRQPRVCILGRTDDDISQAAISYLVDRYAVKYVGWADEQAKQYYMSNSAIFIYPSVYDNNPIVVHEALSYGLPCVLWDLPYSKASFKNTTGVIRVTHSDTSAFARAIFDTINNPGNLSKDAIKFEESGKTELELAHEYTLIYNNIINSKND